MSYRESEQRSSNGPLKPISWTLVATGAVMLVLLTWNQIIQDSVSRRYGIEVRRLNEVLWLVGFVGVELGALYAARHRQYGLSIGLSGFLVSLLGVSVLFALAAM